MPANALRPRSVTELVDAAFLILRAHYPQFLMCSAISAVPLFALQLLSLSNVIDMSSGEGPSGTLLLGSFMAAFGSWIAYALMSSVIITCASQAYLGDPVDVGAAVRRVWPRLPAVMLASIMRIIVVWLGALLLLVGALYVSAMYFAVMPIIILENSGANAAFTRSKALSHGRKRHILNTLGLVLIIYFVINVGIQIFAAISGNIIVQSIVSTCYTVLVYPVVAITETLVYYDARIRSEGLDIQLMADELSAAPAQPSGV